MDLEKSLSDPDVAVLAVPSPFTRATAHRMAPFTKKGQIIVNVAKGVEENTLMTLSEIISQEIPQADVCVLSRLTLSSSFTFRQWTLSISIRPCLSG